MSLAQEPIFNSTLVELASIAAVVAAIIVGLLALRNQRKR